MTRRVQPSALCARSRRGIATRSNALLGLLSYFPTLRTQLDATFVDLPRPRAPIVELLGPAYQNCPVLVVLDPRPEHAALLRESPDTGRRYCTGADEITAYLQAAYGVSAAHP